MSGKRVMVTGGAGFIGSYLVEELVRASAQVTVVDNFASGRRENLSNVKDRVRIIEGDVRQPVWWTEAPLEQCDVLFHFASNAYVPPSVDDPLSDFEINAAATLRLLQAMREQRWQGRFIYASSAGVYGNPARLPIAEEDPTNPISPYGVSKLAGERYTALFAQLYGMRTTSLRFFSTYGPRQRKQIVYDFIRKLQTNPKVLEIIGDGTQTRDLIYVTDTVHATLTVADKAPMQGEVYNVATGIEITTRGLAEEVAGAMGLCPRLDFTGAVRPGDPLRWRADGGRLRHIGYKPGVELVKGIHLTIEWLNGTL